MSCGMLASFNLAADFSFFITEKLNILFRIVDFRHLIVLQKQLFCPPFTRRASKPTFMAELSKMTL
jgi:hypothetical protein